MTTVDATAHIRARIFSIDTVRGLIMIIMTLDHVRDFLMVPGPSPLAMKTTTVILFFTRWITHFCAPTFVFLSGVSVFLAGQKRSRRQLSLFLLKRGLWLIASDLLIISLIFTFDPTYHILVLEVLWAIGAGMIILSVLIYAPMPVIAAIGIVILFGHNLLDNVTPTPLMTVLFSAVASVIPTGTNRAIVELYAILPWSAPMFLGYVFGTLYADKFDPTRRRQLLTWLGIAFCVLFIILRLANGYGDQSPWHTQQNAAHTFLSFLNVSKQPPSLLYFSVTLGPILLLLAFTEHFQNRFSTICRAYGNVPYFYFIVHLCTIRVINILLIIIQGLPIKFTGFPLVWQADGFGYPLWAIYLFWLLVVAILYLPCKWYGNYKRTHTQWWLSYL